MAHIIGLQQQQDALNEINATLKAVTIINKALEANNPTKTYSIRFTDAEGKKLATDFTADKEEVNKLLLKNKQEKREYVLELAREFTIGLTPEDKDVLGIENDQVQDSEIM